jgi:hypothetical protein
MSGKNNILKSIYNSSKNMYLKIKLKISSSHGPKHRLARILPNVKLTGNIKFMGRNVINKNAVLKGDVTIGYASTIGINNT